MYSVTDTLAGGLPHSDVHGSTPARGSPWLFAACHVLHRLLVPRHPLNALHSLEISTHHHNHLAMTAAAHHAQTPSQCPCTAIITRPEHSPRTIRGYSFRHSPGQTPRMIQTGQQLPMTHPIPWPRLSPHHNTGRSTDANTRIQKRTKSDSPVKDQQSAPLTQRRLITQRYPFEHRILGPRISIIIHPLDLARSITREDHSAMQSIAEWR